MVCPTEPNSSVSLNLMKLKRSLCGSHRWDRVASVPFEQDMVRDIRRVQCHQKRPVCRFYVLKEIPRSIKVHCDIYVHILSSQINC